MHKEASRWVTYARVDRRSWCITIAYTGGVSFLTAYDQSKTPARHVDTRYNTRSGVIALGRLLGVLLTILRGAGPNRPPEVSFDPESSALGMPFRHIAKNPLVLNALKHEGYGLISLSGKVYDSRNILGHARMANNKIQSVTVPSG